MIKIAKIIKKNFHVLLHNKFSYFLLFFGPLIIIIIMGVFFYNDNSYSINLGIYEEQNSNFEQYVEIIKKNNFKIIEFKSENECINAIRSGVNPACLIFENDKNSDKKEKKIKLIIDSSKNNLANIIENLIKKTLGDKKEEIQINNIDLLLESLKNNSKAGKNIYEKNNQSINLTTLIEKNNNLMKTYSSLIDFSLNLNSLKIKNIEDKANSIKKTNSDFVILSLKIVNQTLFYLDNLSSKISSLNLNSSTELNKLISNTKSEVNLLSLKIESQNDSYNLEKIKTYANSTQKDLIKVKNSLDDISKKIKEINLENDNNINILINNSNEINKNSLNILNSYSNLENRNSQNIVKPFKLDIDKLSENKATHLNSLISSLIASLILIMSIIISSNLIIMEKQNPAFFRNFISKCSSMTFVIGNFLTLLIIIFLQIFMIITVYYLLFLKVNFLAILYLGIIILISISVFILIGMLIAYLSKNETQNVIFSFIVIFLLFAFSGNLLPLESLSNLIIKLSSYNPFLLTESALRKILIFNLSLNSFKSEIFTLIIYIIILLDLNYLLESINKKRGNYQNLIHIKNKISEKFKKK